MTALSPILTDAEIDALGCPKGTTPGQRPGDPDILVGSPWNAHLPLAERQAQWRARELATARRMIVSLGARAGWTEEQHLAAESVALRVPCHAEKRGKMHPVNVIAIYTAAAQRAC